MPEDPRTTLDAWVLATVGRAVAYARSLVPDSHQAEDIVQDCYYRLLRRADAYDLPTDGMKLLYRAITNACINWTQRTVPMTSLNAVPFSEDQGWRDSTAAPPEEQAIYRELLSRVDAGLAQLPPLARAALELKAVGHSQADVAEILGITSSHAGVLIHRARRALARYLNLPNEGE